MTRENGEVEKGIFDADLNILDILYSMSEPED
jgi:hypothetical protein